MRAVVLATVVSSLAWGATPPRFAVCAGTSIATRTDATSAINTCVKGSATVAFGSVQSMSSACAGSITISSRDTTETTTYSRMIKVIFSGNTNWVDGSPQVAVLATEPGSTAKCAQGTLPVTTSNGAVDTTRMETRFGTVATDFLYGSICSAALQGSSGGFTTDGNAGLTDAATECPTTTSATGPIEFVFKYTCPSAASTTAYLRVGAETGTGTTDEYGVITVTCTAASDLGGGGGVVVPVPAVTAVPSTPEQCLRASWCTPYTGAPTNGQYANNCAETSATGTGTTYAAILTTCQGASTNTACTTTVGAVGAACGVCTNTPGLTLSGMIYNDFFVRAVASSQIDAVQSSIQAGTIPNVPQWASLSRGSNGCTGTMSNVTTCAGCTVPDGVYPTSSQGAVIQTLASTEEAANYAERRNDHPTFRSSGSTIATSLVGVSTTATTRALRQNTRVTIFANCPLVGTTTSNSTSTTECCDDFSHWLKCDIELDTSVTAFSCGGAATRPAAGSCSSSDSSLWYLLLLLLIPLICLLVCSIIICCILMRRRKRGWQERQLATFDPEPHPAAPPPPVNVYEECPQYAHHDGASGYSDVHHASAPGGDEFYSHA